MKFLQQNEFFHITIIKLFDILKFAAYLYRRSLDFEHNQMLKLGGPSSKCKLEVKNLYSYDPFELKISF